MPDLLTPITSDLITRALAVRYFGYRKNVVVPRCNFAGWEADVLVLRPSGWMEEVEIKISVADFRREFTKKADKHRRFTHGVPKYNGGLDGFEADNPLHEPITYRSGKPYGFWDWSAAGEHMLRRFWFAVPEEILPKVEAEVPGYAGILRVDRWYESVVVREVKAAPVLPHGRKLAPQERSQLLRLAYLRYWDVFDRDMAALGGGAGAEESDG